MCNEGLEGGAPALGGLQAPRHGRITNDITEKHIFTEDDTIDDENIGFTRQIG